MTATSRITIVGASLAGLRAAESLRANGFNGQLTLIGDEPYPPYDRPPLSKAVLAGKIPADRSSLARFHWLDAEWRLGTPAIGLDLATHQILLGDGAAAPFDQLVIATGVRARPWPDPAVSAMTGVHTIRTRDDAARLRARLARRPARVVVIGGGFIGCEVASVCRDLDLTVTQVVRGPAPLANALGAAIGAVAADLLLGNGVDLRTYASVVALEADAAGHLRRVVLDDGSAITADMAVVALGTVANTEWLQGSGLASGPDGVVCDRFLRAMTVDDTPRDDIVAAGDLVRWPHPLVGNRPVSVQHWHTAVRQAELAARNLLAVAERQQPFADLPAFWSSLFGVTFKSVGFTGEADDSAIVQGSPEDGRLVVAFGREGRMIGAAGIDASKWLPFHAQLVKAASPFPPTLTTIDRPDEGIAPRDDRTLAFAEADAVLALA